MAHIFHIVLVALLLVFTLLFWTDAISCEDLNDVAGLVCIVGFFLLFVSWVVYMEDQ